MGRHHLNRHLVVDLLLEIKSTSILRYLTMILWKAMRVLLLFSMAQTCLSNIILLLCESLTMTVRNILPTYCFKHIVFLQLPVWTSHSQCMKYQRAAGLLRFVPIFKVVSKII